MTNTNESSMQKMMREKTRQEHKQAVQDYAKKGFDNGYNLRSYMQMIDVIGGPKDAEEYTEICEDFMEPVSGNIHAEQNLIFVDPTKYKINESQYIRIFKTPLSIDGRLFILVKPKEHKLSKKTYYELAKIAFFYQKCSIFASKTRHRLWSFGYCSFSSSSDSLIHRSFSSSSCRCI